MPVFIVVLQEHAQEEHKKLLESITTMLAKSLSQRTELVSGHLKNRNQLSYCTTSARCMHSSSVYSGSSLYLLAMLLVSCLLLFVVKPYIADSYYFGLLMSDVYLNAGLRTCYQA